MKIAIAADHGGYRLKEEIKKLLEEMGHEVDDYGCHGTESVDYPDFVSPVTQQVKEGHCERGILICGTGIGMSIAANKVKGIRCALAHDVYSAKMTRLHNDSNVLALGERVIGPGLAVDIVQTWLETPYEGGRHARRLAKVEALEDQ